MLSPAVNIYRKKRNQIARRRPQQPAPPSAPVLIAAVYDADPPNIELFFDRAVDVSGLEPLAFILLDGPDEKQYAGDGPPSVFSPTHIRLMLQETGIGGGPDVLLTIFSNNGIVAVQGGLPLGALSQLPLPYP